jgi:cyclophilin family peptidyl-prolyl cis-trans isomerase
VTAPAPGLRLPAVAVLALALAACGSGSKHASGTTTTDANGCIPVSAPAAGARHETKPTARLSPSKTYDVTFKTNCGSFTIRLATKTSPATTASFASLTGKGFFDHTIFHRIVPGFVIQGGDPTATGTGGPGYTTIDPPPPSTRYTLGVAAMAKSASDPAGASGSQFFVVTAPDAGLPPEYAVLGKVVRGLPVVQKIGKLGDPASGGEGTPTETVEIEKATLHVG